MTKILLAFLVLLSVCSRGSAETQPYTVITRDSYGDGWNCGVLTITNKETDQVVVTSTGPADDCKYAPPGDTCERTETISLECGTFSAQQSGLAHPADCSWIIHDGDGATFAQGSGTNSELFSTCSSLRQASPRLLDDDTPPAQFTVSGLTEGCPDKTVFEGLYKPVAKTKSDRWYYKSEKDMYIYWDSDCDGTGPVNVPNLWIFSALEPSTTPVNDLDEDNACVFSAYKTSTSMTPPLGTTTWTVTCGGWISIPLTLKVAEDRLITTTPDELYNTISQYGNNVMTSGDRALIESGTYTCTTCDSSVSMFKVELFGNIVCQEDGLSCVLDGQLTRIVMWISETGGSKLTIKGIKFYRGDAGGLYSGGGMVVDSGCKVTLEFCAFTSCSAYIGGAIYNQPDTTLLLYGTNFTSNDADVHGAKDVSNSGIFAVFDICPDGWVGIPDEGVELSAGGVEIAGIPNSFSIGSCTVCPLGKAGASAWYDMLSSSTCQTCPIGRFRSAEVGLCTICGAGKYNDKDGSDASDHESCQSCPAGKHLADDGLRPPLVTRSAKIA
ncbi:hypothetical protein TrVE_jg5503 [Triparma verrucosa]|uniref:Tyrosine-protein kinase ephrin type A/B receptor-like domain-containing protein n=1 Tax=Triparma verrucosa TaxID=1606542 RepID=A0A9W7KX20_9STRA|nr:hypothetical protein TrVE_jg5503 [Triparma verrucosa]